MTTLAFLCMPQIAGGQDMPTDEEVAANPTILFECFDRNFAKIDDYSGTLMKKEVLRGKAYPEEEIYFQYRKPDKFHLQWRDANNDGKTDANDPGSPTTPRTASHIAESIMSSRRTLVVPDCIAVQNW